MKPDTQTAMRNLIAQVRTTFPFDLPEANLCTGVCQGCSLKLLEFVGMELAGWEARLAEGEKPNLGDLDRLAKICKKTYRVLERNGLMG